LDVQGQAVQLRVVAQLDQREVAMRAVSEACRVVLRTQPDADPPRLLQSVISAVGEAFNNIAVHGYRDAIPGVVEIEVSLDPRDRLAVELRDYGRSFDPRQVRPPDLDALPESGMGLFIMNETMDEVGYRAGSPNVLRLVKRLT
jgi:serine/threonine-protein kinase RsbW